MRLTLSGAEAAVSGQKAARPAQQLQVQVALSQGAAECWGGEPVLLAGPKCKPRLFPDTPGRARGPIALPGVPGRAKRANLCARERSAYHGPWSAGAGRGHDDRNCSRSKLSPPIVTPRTLVCVELSGVCAGEGGLCSWLFSTTARLLFHPSRGGRHTPGPGSVLCLSHNFRRICRQRTFSFYFALGLQVQSLGFIRGRLHSPSPASRHLRPHVHSDLNQCRARIAQTPQQEE